MEKKPPPPQHVQLSQQRTRWLLPLLASLFLSSLLISASTFSSPSSSSSVAPISSSYGGGGGGDRGGHSPLFVEDELRASPRRAPPGSEIPRIAYLISGSAGDGESLRRVLRALYHPLNTYAVHLDLEASAAERMELAAAVRDDPVYARFGNVRVIVKANLVTYRGPTMVANTLHAAAVLLREGGDWDWFVNLSASDYPLVTQDDLLYALSGYPRHLNFIEHTSDIGWKEFHRAKPIIIDPGLHSSQKSDVFWITERRTLPSAFKLFTGSAWMMLSREFMEFCLGGGTTSPDAAHVLRQLPLLPGGLLPHGYLQRGRLPQHDGQPRPPLHLLGQPPRQHPHFLELADLSRMVASNAPFARKFPRDAPVLDKIDADLLRRRRPGASPTAAGGPPATAPAPTCHSFLRRRGLPTSAPAPAPGE
ncbi:unnamed protein product [Spirodela intermedia]|uniref:Uncharacterized protein n=1 Tax=Spirodela intermedia TaxID=51605 RepID=A0A7I8JAD7_SPIIN|nr:unnamed protein product [Spirodela intermedia]CAA6666392.1 unnamed protein product [Spirodela intermedia]